MGGQLLFFINFTNHVVLTFGWVDNVAVFKNLSSGLVFELWASLCPAGGVSPAFECWGFFAQEAYFGQKWTYFFSFFCFLVKKMRRTWIFFQNFDWGRIFRLFFFERGAFCEGQTFHVLLSISKSHLGIWKKAGMYSIFWKRIWI